MAKDNSFVETLQNSVEDGVLKSELELRKEELEKAIADMEADVIVDPKSLEKLKKELAAVNKEIKKEQAERAEKTGDVVGKDATEKDTDEVTKEEEEKEEEIKDEKVLNEDEKEKEEKNEQELKEAYHDAIVAMYQKRIDDIRKQINDGKLVIDEADYDVELELEAKMYEARDAYMKLGKEDPYMEFRSELRSKEIKEKDPIERELRERNRKYKLFEEEIKKIDKEEQEINEKLLNPNITDVQAEDLNKKMEELGQKRKKVEKNIAEVKADLVPIMKERKERKEEREELDVKKRESSNIQDIESDLYQEGKVQKMNSNFDKARKLENNNLKKRIEQREDTIKHIKNELRETDDMDFERRITLLNKLDSEKNMLEADEKSQDELKRGVNLSEVEMKRDANEKSKEEEYRQEQFDKKTDDAREFIEKQNGKIGDSVVENPTLANEKQRNRKDEIGAATFAAVYDSPKPGPDTPLDNIVQYEVAKNCVIPALSDKVRDVNNPEDAKAYLDHAKTVEGREARQADKELDDMQNKLMKDN